MKNLKIYLSAIILSVFVVACSATVRETSAEPPSHKIWNELLQKHVKGNGLVDYRGFKSDKVQLEQYLKLISTNAPDKKSWSENEQIAYWINAYNAYTIKLIIDNYPLESIQDLHPTIKIPGISTVWHKKFFKIGGEDSSLDEIEHDILRKEFNEPRIHFAINCASFSCPPLRNEAFVADKLDNQLDEMARSFINDSKRNKITASNPKVSKIFSWFTKDFKNNGSVIDFLNQYSKVKINNDADINYLDYDWSLNDVADN